MFFKKMCVIIVSRMGKIARYLNQLIVGNVFDAPEVLEAYSTDCSILKIKPKAVAVPESTEDVQKLVRFSYQMATKGLSTPITVRGAGHDEMGAGIGSGLVISTEKLNSLLESDKRERLVRVQAGITLKELNTALSVNGLTIPIKGHDSETIGGLISNCPADAYSGKYGGIMNYVERLEIVLPNGEILQTNRLNNRAIAKKSHEKTLEASIYRKITKLAKTNKTLMRDIRKNSHSLHGYTNITKAIQKNTLDLMPLYFGAQGTLGVITEVILKAVPINHKSGRVVATFTNFKLAQRFLDLANSMKPCELNLFDVEILKTAERTGKKLGLKTDRIESGFVVFAKFDRKTRSCLRKIASVRKVLPKDTQFVSESSKTKPLLDEFENSLASFLNQVRSGERVPLVTDFYLPPQNIQKFLDDLQILRENLGIDLALFGSYSASNYSLRPRFKIDDKNFAKKAVTFLRTGNFIVKREGGSITGGSPEGRVKALVTNNSMTETEMAFYKEIKDIFDRYQVMNPDDKLGTDAKFVLGHIRTTGINKIVI